MRKRKIRGFSAVDRSQSFPGTLQYAEYARLSVDPIEALREERLFAPATAGVLVRAA
jgi:hypothetical protein